jgi:site-specific DNA-cytosine methylase
MDDGGVVVYAGGKPAEIVNSLTSRQGQRMPSRLDMSNVAVFIKGRRATARPDDADSWHTEGPAPTLNTFDNTGPSRATVIAVHMKQDPINGPISPAMGVSSQGMGVLDPRGEAPVVRRLTPRECERLMGWPDDHTAQGVTPEGKVVKISDNQRGRMIGNGVATPVARFIAQAIMEVEA